MSDSINSPPYPAETINSRGLYQFLTHIRNWVITEQSELRDRIPGPRAQALVPPDEIDTDARWEQVSILDKYTVFMTLRRIREFHDNVLREHEAGWDSKEAVRKRYAIVIMAQNVLTEAFTDPEKREAQQQTYARKAQRELDIMQKHLRKVLIPPELRDDAEEPDTSEDDWFASEDDTE